jgi:outer membrane protein TolC
MLKFRKFIYCLSSFAICISANALTLNEALINTYKTNPELNAQRESLKSADEQIMQSLARWMPTVKLQTQKQYITSKKIPSGGTSTTNSGYDHTLTITQNIFRSGADVANMQASYYSIEQARAVLINKEQEIFLKAVQAYMSTLQAKESYNISLESEKDSANLLKGAIHRFKAGDIDKMELELAKASFASAESQRIIAHANYEAAKANFTGIIGLEAENLTLPGVNIATPETLNNVIDISILKNPSVLSAKNTAKSKEKSIDIQRGDVLPQVDLQHSIADRTKAINSSSTNRGLKEYTTVLTLSAPIFTAAEWSQLRATKRDSAAAQNTLQSTLESVKSAATQYWMELKANKASLTSREVEYKARRIAYEGAQSQERAGIISIFNLVEYKNGYFTSYTNFVSARSSYYNSIYKLKSIIGECTAKGLALDVEYYDPLKNYNSIKWQLIGGF